MWASTLLPALNVWNLWLDLRGRRASCFFLGGGGRGGEGLYFEWRLRVKRFRTDET